MYVDLLQNLAASIRDDCILKKKRKYDLQNVQQVANSVIYANLVISLVLGTVQQWQRDGGKDPHRDPRPLNATFPLPPSQEEKPIV